MYVKENDTQAQPQALACLNMSENVICNEQQVQAISSTKLCASSSYLCIFFDVE